MTDELSSELRPILPTITYEGDSEIEASILSYQEVLANALL